MALFKIFWGKEEKLSDLPVHEGYAYFTVDKNNLYIDIDSSHRVQVNGKGALGLLRSTELEGDREFVDADEFVSIDDIIDVQHGGTGLDQIPANTVLVGNGTESIKTVSISTDNFVVGGGADGIQGIDADTARGKLSVDSSAQVDDKVKKATTVAYTTTLTVERWVDEENGTFTQSYSQASLKCGKNGDVPPIVTYTDNLEEYSKIDKADAEAGVGIKFYTSEKPQNPIPIIIVDMA